MQCRPPSQGLRLFPLHVEMLDTRGGADIVCLQLVYNSTRGAYIVVYVCDQSHRLATG